MRRRERAPSRPSRSRGGRRGRPQARPRSERDATAERDAAPDRQLHGEVGDGGAGDGHRHASEVERDAVQVGAIRCEDELHRPVPQVEAVRDRADPHEWREGRSARTGPRGCTAAAMTSATTSANTRNPPRYMNSRPSPIVTYAAMTARSARAPVPRRIRPPTPVGSIVPAFEDEREQRAHEEGVHPRVRAEVRPARIAAWPGAP